MRKSVVALAAALALGAATLATGAMAQKAGGNHGGPSVGAAAPSMSAGGGAPAAPMTAGPSKAPGGSMPSVNNRAATLNGPASAPMNAPSTTARNYAWHDHDHDHHGHHHFHGAFGFGGLYAYEPDYYYDYDSCYQPRLVRTRYGLRWRRVWVCD